jgi:hypothetical protein
VSRILYEHLSTVREKRLNPPEFGFTSVGHNRLLRSCTPYWLYKYFSSEISAHADGQFIQPQGWLQIGSQDYNDCNTSIILNNWTFASRSISRYEPQVCYTHPSLVVFLPHSSSEEGCGARLIADTILG